VANSEPDGKVTMAWTIEGEGYVSSVQIMDSTFQDNLLSGCLWHSLLSWRFPASFDGRPTDVRLTWRFKGLEEAEEDR
jgi:hypothetical protein